MPIKHVFVLMLENRSFDHMLGFSGLVGTDAATGQPTRVNGLTGNESNSFGGISYTVGRHPPVSMQVDPGHEFEDVLEQLCGVGATYAPHSAYPPINNSGFVSDYATQPGFTELRSLRNAPRPGDVMQCFDPPLPVLTALAEEFAVCDSWFSSMPGPTWPNRFFALAGSSGGLDRSPTKREITFWNTLYGFRLKNGSVFDRGIKWRIYAGNILISFAHALRGIHITRIRRYANFGNDLSPGFDAQFTWIEPSYGHVTTDYKDGTSQHPLDGVAAGELLIKNTYEAIRRSPLWNSSMLIVTWDEHGGFYDHVAPPIAVPPGDVPYSPERNSHGFDFNQYGPRVPAVIVSPFIPRNIIDHRLYDHASIPATLEKLFNRKPMTARDAQARDVRSLASLTEPREDAPLELPDAPQSERPPNDTLLDALDVELPEASRPDELIDQARDNLRGFVYLATRVHLQISPMTQYLRVLSRSAQVRTRRDARNYIEEVRRLLAAARPLQVLR